MTFTNNSGKLMSRRIPAKDGATITLNYRAYEAHAMRFMLQSIRLKGDRKAPMSLIARRSMSLYLERLAAARENRPDVFAEEIAELEKMTTPVPTPA